MAHKYALKNPTPQICPVCGKAFVPQHHTAINCSRECTQKATNERAKKQRQEVLHIGYGLDSDPWQTKRLPPSVTENALLDPLPR